MFRKRVLTEELSRTPIFRTSTVELINSDIEKDLSNPRALISLMAEHTGMRIGELVALHKSDINSEKGYIHVHRQQHLSRDPEGHLVFEEVLYTKDEKKHPHNGRKVPIFPECQRAIDLALALPGESQYLFHDKKGAWFTTDSCLQNLRLRCRRITRHILADKAMNSSAAKAVADMPTNNHTFRIAFNSRLIDMGFNARERALVLGHAVETNERFYSKRDERTLDNIIRRVRQTEES